MNNPRKRIIIVNDKDGPLATITWCLDTDSLNVLTHQMIHVNDLTRVVTDAIKTNWPFLNLK